FMLAGNAAQAQDQLSKHAVGLQAAGFAPEARFKDTSPAAGVFYEYRFSRLLGVNVAAQYHKIYMDGMWYGGSGNNPDGPFVKFRQNYLEIPVNIKLNLNTPEAKGWHTDVLLGGTYSYFLHTIIRNANTGEKLAKFKRMRGQPALFYGNLGFELRSKPGTKYWIGFNPGLRVGLSDYAYDSFVYLQLRLGRNL